MGRLSCLIWLDELTTVGKMHAGRITNASRPHSPFTSYNCIINDATALEVKVEATTKLVK